MSENGSSGRRCSASLCVLPDLAVFTGNPRVLVQVTALSPPVVSPGGDSKLCVTYREKTGRDLGCGTWQLLLFPLLACAKAQLDSAGGKEGEQQTLGSARSSHSISASGRSGWASLEQPKKNLRLFARHMLLWRRAGLVCAATEPCLLFGAGTLPILALHSCRDQPERAEVCEF